MKKNDMNLLLTYQKEVKRKANQPKPVRFYIILILAAILILGAYALKVFLDNNSLRNEITSIKNYIENPKITEKMDEIYRIQADLKTLDEIEAEANLLGDVISFKPKFDSKILDLVYYERPTSIKFTLLEYEENTIILNMTGTRPSDFSNYALRLQRTYQFADVSYDGYAYDTEKRIYIGAIRCIMKGGE
jgi:hypothetical protein